MVFEYLFIVNSKNEEFFSFFNRDFINWEEIESFNKIRELMI